MLAQALGRLRKVQAHGALILVGILLMGAAPDPLKPFQWKMRLLVVSAPKGDDPGLRAQDAIMTADSDGQADRDMKVIRLVGPQGPSGIEAAALRERLSLPPDRFEVVLIGKDGATVLRRRQPIALAELFARIDAMPMRQDELRKRAPAPSGRQ